jgi:hypothetical protein
MNVNDKFSYEAEGIEAAAIPHIRQRSVPRQEDLIAASCGHASLRNK